MTRTATPKPPRRGREPRPKTMRLADETMIAFLRLRLAEQGLHPTLRDGRILRPPQAAHYTGLSVKALWWHRRHGSGPAYIRLGERNAIGYVVRDLDAWLLARSTAPRAPKGA